MRFPHGAEAGFFVGDDSDDGGDGDGEGEYGRWQTAVKAEDYKGAFLEFQSEWEKVSRLGWQHADAKYGCFDHDGRPWRHRDPGAVRQIETVAVHSVVIRA
jgi:hypothetical protein